MNFKVSVGTHDAEVSLPDAEDGDFSGYIKSDEFGNGTIAGTRSGKNFTGNVSLDGYDAAFSAVVDGTSISGKISYGWMFSEQFCGSSASSSLGS